MGTNEYVVLFVAVVYFLGGYVLGRFHNRRPRWTHTVEPDPIPEPVDEDIADVIPLRPMAVKPPRDKVDKFAALGWIADHSRTSYRGLGRRRTD
jgi:hypothetical protein